MMGTVSLRRCDVRCALLLVAAAFTLAGWLDPILAVPLFAVAWAIVEGTMLNRMRRVGGGA
jgi:hypothetical protein